MALFRWRGLVGGLVTATAVLAVASAGGPLFISSAGSAAVNRRLTPLSPSTAGLSISMELVFPRTHRLQAATAAAGPSIRTSDLVGIQERRLKQLASRVPELGRPIFTVIGPTVLAARPYSDQLIDLRPVARTDFASHIVVVERVRGRGLWIPESSAEVLGVEPGDSVLLTSDRRVPTRIKGTYRSLAARAPLPPYWSPLAKLILSPLERPTPGNEPPAVALGDLPTIRRLASRMHWRGEARWELPLARYDLTLPAARGLSARIREIADDVRTSTFGRGYAVFASAEFFEIGGVRYVDQRTSRRTTGLPGVVQDATETVALISVPVETISLLGVLVSLALVATAGFYTVHRRAIEYRLLAARGIGGVSTALRAAVEGLIPALLASALTAILAYLVLHTWGVGAVDVGDVRVAIERVVLAVAVGLAVYGGSVAATANRLLPLPARRLRWTAAFTDLLLIAMAVAAFVAMARHRVTIDRPTVDLSLVLLPLAALAAGAGLVFRYAQRGLRRVRYTRTRSRLHLYLALRRLTNQSVLALVLAAAAAVAVGLLVYTNMLVSSGNATMHAKSHVFVGSDAEVYVNDLDYAPDLDVPTTTVVKVDDLQGADGQQYDVLGIDPGSFTAAAYWDDSFANAPLPDLISRLHPRPGGDLPAIVTGGATRRHLAVGNARIGIDVVGRAEAFPGMLGQDPLVVVDGDQLVQRLRTSSATGSARAYVWAKGAADEVLEAMARAGLAAEFALTARDVASSRTLLALGWTLSTMRVLGLAMGLLALGGLLLYMTARQRARILSYGLMRRMGLRSRVHRAALAIEIACTLLGALVVGAGLGAASAVLLHEVIDLLPAVPPDPLLRFPVTDVSLSLLVGLAAAVGGSWALQRATGRANLGEVLRAGE
jgi:putative ABC transport system permease protein